MKIMITGFDPFGGESQNPATEAVRLLKAPPGVELVKQLNVPTRFGIGETICRDLDLEWPDVLLCIGQAGGRDAITPERIAINLRHASIADNAGVCPKEEPIDPAGPAAYFTGLPVGKLTEAIQAAGVPARISNTAGTFVCNDLFYTVLHHIARENLPIRAGFIHVPFLPAQAAGKENMASMALKDMVTGLEAVLTFFAREEPA